MRLQVLEVTQFLQALRALSYSFGGLSIMTKDNTEYPPVRFPKTLRDELQEEANERARSRGRKNMSIAEYIAERRLEWIGLETELEEEG
jgi:hypothetical protein